MGKKENSKKGKIMDGISQNVSTFRYSAINEQVRDFA